MRKFVKNVLLLLLISFTLISTKLMSQETIVHCTVYHAVPEQTNEDPQHTAFMFKLDLDNPYKHRIIAVSRDLLEEFPGGTKVRIEGTKYDGIFIVNDKMNKRWTKRIDILINEDMQIGSWSDVKLSKVQ